MSKLTISAFAKMKEEGKKVTFITAYDAQMSRVAQGAGIDMILVGDSVGNNVLGYTSTHPVTMDDMIRHAITKMSYLHFTSTDTYRNRIIQMGEDPSRVFNVGALGLDNILNTKSLFLLQN